MSLALLVLRGDKILNYQRYIELEFD